MISFFFSFFFGGPPNANEDAIYVRSAVPIVPVPPSSTQVKKNIYIFTGHLKGRKERDYHLFISQSIPHLHLTDLTRFSLTQKNNPQQNHVQCVCDAESCLGMTWFMVMQSSKMGSLKQSILLDAALGEIQYLYYKLCSNRYCSVF